MSARPLGLRRRKRCAGVQDVLPADARRRHAATRFASDCAPPPGLALLTRKTTAWRPPTTSDRRRSSCRWSERSAMSTPSCTRRRKRLSGSIAQSGPNRGESLRAIQSPAKRSSRQPRIRNGPNGMRMPAVRLGERVLRERLDRLRVALLRGLLQLGEVFLHRLGKLVLDAEDPRDQRVERALDGAGEEHEDRALPAEPRAGEREELRVAEAHARPSRARACRGT